MFVIKVILGVLLVFLSTKIALVKAKKLKEKHLYYSSARLMCENLESELMYLKRPLNDALEIDYPSYSYAKTINSVIKNNGEYYYPDFIVDDEQEKFNLLFMQLGKSDTRAQMSFLASAKEDFYAIEKDKRVEYQKFYSLTLKIGFLIGLMLFILVI